MGRFILAVIALVALLLAILVVAPGLVPVGAYKDRLEAAASDAVGREVTFSDDLSFKLVPKTAFQVNDLVIANEEGFDEPHLARVKSADIGVRLFPLFRGSVEVDRFILTEPDINLARAADGRVNWNIAQGPADAPAQDAGEGQSVRSLQLGDVRIVDGRARYADAAAGKTYDASDIDLVFRLASLAEPLEAEGTLLFQGAPSRVDIVLTSLEDILNKTPANLKLDLKLGETKIGGDLEIATEGALAYAGDVRLDAPNLPNFAALLGTPLADAPGFDTLSVAGRADGGPTALRISDASIEFDDIDAGGDIALDWSGARPRATGALAAGSLDLRPYLPPPSQSARGFPAWSTDKLDFSSLRNIDANLNLTAEKIFLNDLELGQSRLRLTIENGRMVADIPELGLYGGGGSGRLVVNARSATPSLTGQFDLGSVDAQPFSQSVLKHDKLLGLGALKLDFSASGSSQAEIMNAIDGSGRFDLADGALKGVNLGKLAKAVADIQQGGLNPAALAAAVSTAQQPHEQTDFSEFLSQFTVENGVMTAPTIALEGPFVTMTGTGSINLPQQRLDLRLAPRAAVLTPEGETRRLFAIPMRVIGTFSEPKIVIDAEALLRGRLEQGARDILGGTLGKKDDGAAGDGEATAPRKDGTKQILEGIFGTPPAEETEDGAAAQETQEEPKSDEEIAAEAIGQIFGFGRKPAEEEDDTSRTDEESPP